MFLCRLPYASCVHAEVSYMLFVEHVLCSPFIYRFVCVLRVGSYAIHWYYRLYDFYMAVHRSYTRFLSVYTTVLTFYTGVYKFRIACYTINSSCTHHARASSSALTLVFQGYNVGSCRWYECFECFVWVFTSFTFNYSGLTSLFFKFMHLLAWFDLYMFCAILYIF